MNHFSKATIKALARKGIRVIGLQGIDDEFGGFTAYILDDNGTQRLRSFRDVLVLASAQ